MHKYWQVATASDSVLKLSLEEGGLGAPAAQVYSKASAQNILYNVYIHFANADAESGPQVHLKTAMDPRLNLRQDSPTPERLRQRMYLPGN